MLEPVLSAGCATTRDTLLLWETARHAISYRALLRVSRTSAQDKENSCTCHLLVDGVDDVVVELLVELVLDLLVLVQLVGNLLAQLGVDGVVLLLLQ